MKQPPHEKSPTESAEQPETIGNCVFIRHDPDTKRIHVGVGNAELIFTYDEQGNLRGRPKVLWHTQVLDPTEHVLSEKDYTDAQMLAKKVATDYIGKLKE